MGSHVCKTAAESSWSNGTVERNNAVLENMVLKIVDSTRCSVKNLLYEQVVLKMLLITNVDEGQKVVTTRWVITVKRDNGAPEEACAIQKG